jgi:hypothetical protein
MKWPSGPAIFSFSKYLGEDTKSNTNITNEIQNLQHTLKVRQTFAALVVQAPACCYQEEGGSHHSHLSPVVLADAKGPLKRD